MRPGDRLHDSVRGVAASKALFAAFVAKDVTPVREPVEILEKRTLQGKHFDLGNGEFHHSQRLMAVHCKADPDDPRAEWEEIDLTLSESGKNVWGFPNSFYGIAIRSDQVSYTYTSRRGHVTTVTLAGVGGTRLDYSQMTTEVEGNKFTWHYAPGIDFYLLCRSTYAEIFKVIKDADSPRTFEWVIDEDDDDNPERPAQFVRQTAGKDTSADEREGAIELLNAVAAETKDKGRRSFVFKEEWTGKVARIIDPVTRQKEYRDNPTYPVLVDSTVTENIGVGADDGNSLHTGTTWGGTATTADFASDISGYIFDGGLRFQTVAIAQGSTVTSATLTVNVTIRGGSNQAKIFGVDQDDLGAWTSGTVVPKLVTATASSTQVNEATTGLKVWTVTTQTGVIVGRAGWVSNNNMGFVSLQQAAQRLVLEMYENAGTDEAQLDITYTAGGGGGVTVKTLAATGVG